MVNYDNHEKVEQFVGIDNQGSYVFVDYLFEQSENHGATGTRIVPVSKEYVQERIESEIKDYGWSPIAHIYDEQDPDMSWSEWIETWSKYELEKLAIDASGGNYWDKVEELCKEHEDFEFYMTDCIGGGRVFKGDLLNPDGYRYLENPELLEDIKKAENGEYFE